MHERVFVAVDQLESRRSLVEFSARLAMWTGAVTRVFHAREFVGRGCAAPLESAGEASLVVEEAVFDLRMSGVGADGMVRSCFNGEVARVIVAEAELWAADIIVVGGPSGRRRPRWAGHGVRRRVVRKARVPVLMVAPPDPFGHDRRRLPTLAG